MAMVSSILPPLQVKDSRWLTLEVCREFQRNKCTRSETECKFAHPPPHVEVQNGRVTCCFDSIKGKCQRKDPPCKYLHPPQHLREQLLQNGRNNLILRNLQMQAIAATNLQPMVPGMIPTDKYRGVNYSANYHDPQNQVLQIYDAGSGKPLSYPPTVCQQQIPVVAHPYLMQSQFNPYMTAGMPPSMAGMMQGVDPSNSQQVQGLMQQTANNQQKLQRADRLESTSTTGSSGMDSWPGSYAETIPTSSQYSPIYFQGVSHMPNMMPMVKRPAVADSKSGIPMYQPGTGTTAYQQAAIAMQLQQPFVPVTIAGHPSGVQRL